MIPTIGRSVHVVAANGRTAPAVITAVHNPHLVNVRVFLDGSNETPALTSVHLHEDEATARAVMGMPLFKNHGLAPHAFWPSRG